MEETVTQITEMPGRSAGRCVAITFESRYVRADTHKSNRTLESALACAHAYTVTRTRCPIESGRSNSRITGATQHSLCDNERDPEAVGTVFLFYGNFKSPYWSALKTFTLCSDNFCILVNYNVRKARYLKLRRLNFDDTFSSVFNDRVIVPIDLDLSHLQR